MSTYAPSQRPIAYPRQSRLDIAVSFPCIAAFLIGCVTPIPIPFVGVLFVGELILSCFAFLSFARSSNKFLGSRSVKRFMLFGFLALCGYVAADLVAGTASHDMYRGWARMFFTMSNFLGLYFMSRKRKAMVPSYFLGYGIGAFVVSLITEGMYSTFTDSWKVIIGIPITLFLLCLLPFLGRIGKQLGPYVIILMAVAHLVLDFRSLSLFCLAIGAMLFAAGRKQQYINVRLFVLTCVSAGVLFGGLYLVTQSEFSKRREESNLWRTGSIIATLKGIRSSPLLGSGSLANNAELQGFQRDAILDAGGSHVTKAQLFAPHNQLLQAWLEGGLLGLLFFTFYGYKLVSALRYLITKRLDRFFYSDSYLLIFCLWALFFSPFRGYERIYIAGALVVICLLDAERAREQRNQAQAFPYSTPIGYRPHSPR